MKTQLEFPFVDEMFPNYQNLLEEMIKRDSRVASLNQEALKEFYETFVKVFDKNPSLCNNK